MAKPRVFVSSTYYDLKHIRASLEMFIESIGFESILSENGGVAYVPDRALDESCYREASTADIFVLIIGGRYGSIASGGGKGRTASAHGKYESVTKKEFETAHRAGIPVYVLVESQVYLEYRTYLQNKHNKATKYAYVDSVNIFQFIDDLLCKPMNNPVYPFERTSQIETWLRDQWAGLFRELLKTRAQQQPLVALSGQIGELKAVNETLKRYIEAVMRGISAEASTQLIKTEEKRLESAKITEMIRQSAWYNYLQHRYKVSVGDFIKAVKAGKTANEFALTVGELVGNENVVSGIMNNITNFNDARKDYNDVRTILGLHPISFSELPPCGKDD